MSFWRRAADGETGPVIAIVAVTLLLAGLPGWLVIRGVTAKPEAQGPPPGVVIVAEEPEAAAPQRAPAPVAPRVSTPAPAASPPPRPSRNVEALLAQLDSHDGYASSASDFRDVLDSLEAKVPESRDRIADMTVAVQEQLAKKRVNMSLLKLMQELDAATPEPHEVRQELSYAEVAGLYIVMKTMHRR